MSTEEVITVCRLCSRNENLSWIFEKHFQTAVEKLQDIIFITTGVKVDSKDVVSQKICKRCLHITIKMSQFRMTALQNDKLLKEKYEVLVKNGGLKVGNTSIKMINEVSSVQSYATELIVHPSVRGLRQEYPNLRVPRSLMKSDISPYVTLQLNEVENYFKVHNRNFMKHCMEVLSQRQKKFREYTKLSEPCKKLSNINSESSEKASDVVELTPSYSHNNMSILQPINIKLTKTDRTEYAIVKNNEEVETPPIKCDLKRKKSPESHSEPSTSKKRNISESCVDFDKGYTKGNLFEFLGLNPKANKNEIKNEVTLEVAYVQTTLETCNICSSVQYNSKELKKHQLQHLRCQFCKNIFKTLTLKEEHLRDKCLFKETMNLPDVVLNKVENDLELRREYPSAFTGFPPVKGMEMDTSIIEILSDDEENLPGTSKSHQSGINSGSKDQKEVNDSDCQDDISDKIIKPEVKIKNYDFLDTISSKATDLEALNYLVKNYGIVKFSQDTGTQYPIPPHKIVQSETEEFSATLKDFQDHLKAYCIPLEIKHKESYQISFNYNPPKEVTRKMCGWDDLIATELKTSSLDDAPVTASTSSHQTMVCVTATGKRGGPKKEKKLEAPEHDDTITNIHNTSLNQQAMLPSTSKGEHERKRKNGLKTANNIISKQKKAVSVKNKATLRKIKNDISVPVNSESECNSTNVSTNGQTTLLPNINEEQKISKNEIQIDNGINNQSKIPAANTYLLPTPSSGSTSPNQHTLVSKSIDQHQVHSTQNLGPIKRILIQRKLVGSTPTNTSTATASTSFSTKGTSLSKCVDGTRIMTGDNSEIQQSLTNNNILQTSSSISGTQQTLIINHIYQNQQDKAVRSRHNISVSQMASNTKNECIAIDKMPVRTSYLSNYKIPKISNSSISQTTSLTKYPDGNEMNTMVNASQLTYSTQVPTVVNSTKNQPTPVSHSTVGNQLNSAVPGSQSTSFNQTMTSNPIKRVILVQNSPGVIKSNTTYLPQSSSLSKSVHRNEISAGVNVLQKIPANNTQVPITLHSSTSSHQQEPIPKTTTNNRYISQTFISSTPINTSNVEVPREKSTYNKKVPKSTSPIQQNLTTNSTNGNQLVGFNQDISKSSIYQTMKSNPSNECSSNPNIPVSSTQTEASEILKTNGTLLIQKTSLSKCAVGNKINGVVNVPKQIRVNSIVPTTLGSSTYSNQLNSISYSTNGNHTSSSVQRNNGTLFNPNTKGCIVNPNIPVNSTRINESEVVKSNTTYLSQNTSLLNGAMKNEVSNKIVGYQQTYGTLLSTAEGSSNSSKQQVLNSTSTGGSQLITAVQISYKTPNNKSMISSNLNSGLILNQKPPVSSCHINASEVRGNNAFSTQKSSLSYSAEPNKMNGELDLCQYTPISDVSTVDAVVPETFGVQSVKKPIILKLLDRNKKKNQLQSVSLLVDKETSSNTESDSRIQGSQQIDIGKIVGDCPSRKVSTPIGQDAITTPVISDGNVPYISNKNLCTSPVPGHLPDHASMNSDKTKVISPTIPNSFPQFLTKPQILSSTETLPSDKTSFCSSTERSSDYFQSTVPLSCTATVSACKTSTDVTLNNNVIDQRTIAKNFIDVKNLLALK